MNFDINTKIRSIKSLKDNKHLVAAFLLLMAVSIYISHTNKSVITMATAATLQADTIIPKGFILYPIQLENIETIKGVIDQFGVIDVYSSSKNKNSTSKKILSKVKIMQAPFNPNEYALLLPEYLSQKMMSETGPFLGVIQNRTETADFSENIEHKPKKINIEYQKGS